jgi:hypothetical protein
MARPWRIEYDGALYHVYSGGNDRQPIFKTADDRVAFLLQLGRMAERFAIDLFGYVLLPNQYDLLLRTRSANLARAMHWFGTAYTRRFNLAHARAGHVFQGRYRSTVVENAARLAELSCHVHLKPVRLMLVSDAADYPWSSFNAYAYGTQLPVVVDTRFILSALPGPDRHRAYRELAAGPGSRSEEIQSKLHHGLLYGSREFVDLIRSAYIEGPPRSDVRAQRRVFCDRDPAHLLDEVAAAMPPMECAAPCGDERSQCDLRMFFLWKTGIFKNREIGSLFGLSHSAVSRRVKSFQDRIKDIPGMASRLAALSEQLELVSIRKETAGRGTAMRF